MKIVLHVNRVVLRGLPLTASQLPAVRAALEGELVRLFQNVDPTRLARVGSTQRLVADPITYRSGQGPARVGRDVARAVHTAANGPTHP